MKIGLLLTLAAIVGAAGCGDDEGTGSGTSAGGSAGSGGSAGGGGIGGEAGGPPAEPFDVPAGEWSFVDFPDSRCINDTPTGIGVNPGTSGDVVLLLAGGNACFNGTSCAFTANTDGYNEEKFGQDAVAAAFPMFDRADDSNPTKDDSFVYVPYCTGDLHLGEKPDGEAGGTPRNFSGHTNLKMYLDRAVATWPDASRVVLAGLSAGGLGAIGSYDTVAKKFAGANVVLIDDSGPYLGTIANPPCLQQAFVDTWGISSALEDCAGCSQGDFTIPFVEHIISTYPNANMAVISSREDGTIANFLGYGTNNCANIESPLPPAFDGALYEAALEDVRDVTTAGSNFKFFLIDGEEHVFLFDSDQTVVDNVTLTDWVRDAITGGAGFANVPTP